MKTKKVVFLAMSISLLYCASAFSMKETEYITKKERYEFKKDIYGTRYSYFHPKTKKLVKKEDLDPTTGNTINRTTYNPETGKTIKFELFNPKTRKIGSRKIYNPETGKLVKWESFDSTTGNRKFTATYDPETGDEKEHITYTYDKTGKLIKEKTMENWEILETTKYSYDPITEKMIKAETFDADNKKIEEITYDRETGKITSWKEINPKTGKLEESPVIEKLKKLW